MIKLFSLKEEKKKEAAEAAGSGEKKVAPGLIRMQKGPLARNVSRACCCRRAPARSSSFRPARSVTVVPRHARLHLVCVQT